MKLSRRPGERRGPVCNFMFKAWIPAFAGMTMLVSVVQASNVALVYENEAAVTQGKFTIASIAPEGVLVSAQLALKAGGHLLVGPIGGNLSTSALMRLDNDLDLAVIRVAEPISNPALQNAFQQKSKAIISFMPTTSEVAAQPLVSTVPVVLAPNTAASGPIAIKLNGEYIGEKPVEMKSNALRKCKFKVEVEVLSSTPVWNVAFEIKSDPQISFWLDGRTTSLNDVPRPTFKYEHQVMFAPLKDGKTFAVKVEAHFIDKEKPYKWTIKVKTKLGEVTQVANVIFH